VEKLSTLSPGADTFTREPNPVECGVRGVAVVAERMLRPQAALRGSLGGAAKMSSSVVAPTSIAPESRTCDGTSEKPMSSGSSATRRSCDRTARRRHRGVGVHAQTVVRRDADDDVQPWTIAR